MTTALRAARHDGVGRAGERVIFNAAGVFSYSTCSCSSGSVIVSVRDVSASCFDLTYFQALILMAPSPALGA